MSHAFESMNPQMREILVQWAQAQSKGRRDVVGNALESMNPQTRRLFVQWARNKGITAPPSTDESMDLLVSQFRSEIAVRAQQVAIGAAGDATYNSDPISKMTAPDHLVRTDGGMLDVGVVETGSDDFAELQRDRQRAMEQAGGDDLAMEQIYRAHNEAKLNQLAPFTRSNPSSMYKALLGNTRTVKVGDQAVQVAYWVADSDGDAQAMTVLFAPVRPIGFDSSTAVFRPYGIIQFGNSAGLVTAEVDIGVGGAQFTVCASSITLQVAMEVLTGAGSVQLSGMLSAQPCVRTAPLTRTKYVDVTLPGDNFVAVPAFAKGFYVQRGTTTGTLQLNLCNNKQLVNSTVTVAPGAQSPLDFIPISGDTYFVDVVNSDITNVELIFVLGL